METTIEIFRVILEVSRKHGLEMGHTFRYPQFHEKETSEYRIIHDKYSLKTLRTPYANFRLNTSGNSHVLFAIKEEVLSRLGEVIPSVEMGIWDKRRFNEELKAHLHLIYDPDGILTTLSTDEGFYQTAKNIMRINWQNLTHIVMVIIFSC